VHMPDSSHCSVYRKADSSVFFFLFLSSVSLSAYTNLVRYLALSSILLLLYMSRYLIKYIVPVYEKDPSIWNGWTFLQNYFLL